MIQNTIMFASFHVYDWEWTDSDWGFGVTQFTVLE